MLSEFKNIAITARPTTTQLRFVLDLVLIDFFFVSAHIVFHLARDTGFPVSTAALNFFSITTDDSPAEIFNFVKLTIVVGLLGIACARTRAPVFLAAAAAFSYAMLDDLLMIHERVAEAMTGTMSNVALFGGLRWQDIAELAALGVPGLFFVVMIWLTGRKRSGDEAVFALLFGSAFIALGAFAAVVDSLHQVVEGYSIWIGKVLSVVEDGGEMLVISFTVALAFCAHRYALARGKIRIGAMERYRSFRLSSHIGCRNPVPRRITA